MSVVLGVHNLQENEPSQQRLGITRLFENNYDPTLKLNDVVLVQVWAGPWPRAGPTRRCSQSAAAGRRSVGGVLEYGRGVEDPCVGWGGAWCGGRDSGRSRANQMSLWAGLVGCGRGLFVFQSQPTADSGPKGKGRG